MLVSLTVTDDGLVREKEQQTIEQLWRPPHPPSPSSAARSSRAASSPRSTRRCRSGSIRCSHCQSTGRRGVVVLNLVFILALLARDVHLRDLRYATPGQLPWNIFIFIISLCMSGFIFPIEAMPRLPQPVAGRCR
jgi:hypothetical protein